MAVRSESVRISAIDDFSTPVAKMAAAAALLKKNLNDLDGTSLGSARALKETAAQANAVGDSTTKTSGKTKQYTLEMAKADIQASRLRKSLQDQAKAMLDLGDGVDDANRSFRDGQRDIDRYSGRLRLIADAALTIGPALIPIGAVAVPAVAGLAAAFGFAAVGAGSAVVAFQGVGDALKAMNKAQLEPTAENLEKARQVMQHIALPAREFVRELTDMGPALKGVRDAAAKGLFSELTPALDDIELALPRVASLFETVASAVGELGADAIESLTGPKWAEFFRFIEAEAPDALADLGSAIGSLTHGFAELWMAFQPLNSSFSNWLKDAAAGFDDWAAGLAQTEGFQEFVDYIRENGPGVAAAMKSISNAVLQVVEAMAPLGGPTLDIIAKFADAIALLADSPLGTPLFALAAGLAAVGRASKFLETSALARGTGLFSENLKSLATTAPAAAISLGTFLDTMSQWDSINRSREATSAYADSVTELADALGQSNVGKYAEDLGIDVQRLAVDLKENGANGEYVTEVLDQLGQSSHGAGAAINSLAGNILPFYTANADKAYDASTDLESILNGIGAVTVTPRLADEIQHLRAVAAGLDGEFQNAATAAQTFADALAELSGWLSKQHALENYRQSIKGVADALKDGFQPKDTDAILAAGDAIAQVASQIQSRSVRADFLKGAIASLEQFAGKGPKAAEAIQPLINQLNKIDTFHKVQPVIDMKDQDFRSKAKAIMNQLVEIDRKKSNPKADLNDRAFTPKGHAALALIEELDRKVAEPKIVADISGVYRGIGLARDALNSINGDTVTTYIATVHKPRAQGGYIAGPGGPTDDQVPAMLSNGEFVMKAAAVRRYGIDAMYAMNEMKLAAGGLVNMTHAKRFADGGGVGGGSTGPELFNNLNDELHRRRRATSGVVDILERERAEREKELKSKLKDAEKERDAAKKNLDAAREFRDGIRDAARSLSEGIASQFDGSSLFGAEDASFASVMGGLKEQAGSASKFILLTNRLKALGLDGAALQSLLQTGNVGLLQDFANQSASDIQAFEDQFNRTQNQAQAAGQAAGFAVFAERQAAANVLVAAALAESKKANQYADRLEKRIERMEKWSEREVNATNRVADKVDALGGSVRDGGRRRT